MKIVILQAENWQWKVGKSESKSDPTLKIVIFFSYNSIKTAIHSLKTWKQCKSKKWKKKLIKIKLPHFLLFSCNQRKLEVELKRTKEELKERRVEMVERDYVDFDPDYEYGYCGSSISRLSCLISRFLFRKPTYICRDRIFRSVKRCYENYSGPSSQFQDDLHMLIATSNASNWFSDTHKLHFHLWLQTLCRRKLTNSYANWNTQKCYKNVTSLSLYMWSHLYIPHHVITILT